jgi:serine/threonine-protein kinase
VAYNLFQRRARTDAAATEFAATVLSLPPGAESVPAGADSAVLDFFEVRDVPDATPSGLGPDTQPDSQPAPADPTVELRPTLSHIGRYALKGLIGQGGLGHVHEAWDPLLSRTVAVKTLHFETARPDHQALDRLFLNEARAAAGLSHPHIVTVHDAGLSDQGVYIAMERLQGCDLRQRLVAGWQPTPGEAAQLVRRVADALAYAHARGVVHCDIKPANIFLQRHDKPKVLDFGIARVAHRSELPVLEGALAGSPHYLAPEQLRGEAVDARTDIHALGVVFYELLARRRAFAGDSLEQITSAVLSHHPAPAHELRPGVPRTLSAIAARAMARDPAERYASAADMAAELRRWVDRHSANEPAAPPLPGPASTRPRRKKGGSRLAPVLLGAAVLAAAGLVALRAARAPEPAPSVAVVARVAVPAVAAAPATAAAAVPENDAAALATAAAEVPASVASPKALRTTVAPSAVPRPRAASASSQAREAQAATAASAVAAAPVLGLLRLAISPWGQIEVDGAPAGTTPPLTQLNLAAGTHQITVRNADFPPHTASVQVSADAPVTVRHHFGP